MADRQGFEPQGSSKQVAAISTAWWLRLITRWLQQVQFLHRAGQPGAGFQCGGALITRSLFLLAQLIGSIAGYPPEPPPAPPPPLPNRTWRRMDQVWDAHGQAAQAIDMMLADLRQKWRELSGGPSMTEGLRRFVAAVDWSVSGTWCNVIGTEWRGPQLCVEAGMKHSCLGHVGRLCRAEASDTHPPTRPLVMG